MYVLRGIRTMPAATWMECPIVTAPPLPIKNLICFLSDPSYQHMLIETIKAADAQTEIILISQSGKYQRESRENYQISVIDPQTFQEAFANIRADYGTIDGILYLWPLDEPGCIDQYSNLVHIFQAIASTKFLG